MHLILTRDNDPHTDIVIADLLRKNAPCIRFNTADFPEHASVRMWCDNDHYDGTLQLGDAIVNLSEIGTVWLRRPDPPGSATFPDIKPWKVDRHKSIQTLASIWDLLRGCFWINPSRHNSCAHHKPYQLQMARQIGFEIPRTLITNNSDEV